MSPRGGLASSSLRLSSGPPCCRAAALPNARSTVCVCASALRGAETLGEELAEAILLDLSAGGNEELGDDLQALRELLPRELLGVEVRDDLLEGDGLAVLGNHEGADSLLEARVGHPDAGDAGDLLMGEKQILHLHHGDVLAPADDDVLRAAGDGDVAVPVQRGPIARLEPAVRRVSLGREGGAL